MEPAFVKDLKGGEVDEKIADTWATDLHLTRLPGHLSQHVGNGRLYLCQLKGQLPREDVGSCSHLQADTTDPKVDLRTRTMRLELLRRLKHDRMPPLEPGEQPNPSHMPATTWATQFLVSQVQAFGAAVDQQYSDIREIASTPIFSQPVNHCLHKRGFNLRHMGLLRSHIRKDTEARKVLLGEMLSRTAKRILRSWLRDVATDSPQLSGSGMELATRACVATFACLCTAAHKASARFWEEVLIPHMLRHYGECAVQKQEHPLCPSVPWVAVHIPAIVQSSVQAVGYNLTTHTSLTLHERPYMCTITSFDIEDAGPQVCCAVSTPGLFPLTCVLPCLRFHRSSLWHGSSTPGQPFWPTWRVCPSR